MMCKRDPEVYAGYKQKTEKGNGVVWCVDSARETGQFPQIPASRGTVSIPKFVSDDNRLKSQRAGRMLHVILRLRRFVSERKQFVSILERGVWRAQLLPLCVIIV